MNHPRDTTTMMIEERFMYFQLQTPRQLLSRAKTICQMLRILRKHMQSAKNPHIGKVRNEGLA